MKRRLAAAAVLTLAVSIILYSQVSLASANYCPPPSIEIYSPIPPPDVHSTASIPLQIRVNILPNQPDITSISYSLDGGANTTLTELAKETGLYYWTTTEGVIIQGNAFRTDATLDNIAEGNHTLTVYSHAADGKEMAKTREFTVDYTYVPPQLPPFTLPNGTSIPPTQTETPPAVSTANLQPLKNPLPYIIIACASISIIAGVMFYRKKSKGFTELEAEEK